VSDLRKTILQGLKLGKVFTQPGSETSQVASAALASKSTTEHMGRIVPRRGIGAPQSITSSIDQQRSRNGEAERIGWVAIDDEFSAGRSGRLSPIISSIREHRREAAGLPAVAG
jgi:hypothetical protein